MHLSVCDLNGKKFYYVIPFKKLKTETMIIGLWFKGRTHSWYFPLTEQKSRRYETFTTFNCLILCPYRIKSSHLNHSGITFLSENFVGWEYNSLWRRSLVFLIGFIISEHYFPDVLCNKQQTNLLWSNELLPEIKHLYLSTLMYKIIWYCSV